MARNRIILLSLFLLWLNPGLSQIALCASVELLTLDPSPKGPILTGINELEKFFTTQKWTVSKKFGPTQPIPSSELQIILGTYDPQKEGMKELPQLNEIVPAGGQSFGLLIVRQDNQARIYAMGRDDIGTMYAAFEILDQMEFGSAETPLADRIVEVKSSPAIPMRGIKVTIHSDALQDPFSWYHLETYWEGYLTALARSRFNFIVVQGIYDWLHNQQYSLFPYMVFLNDFPAIGLLQESANRNLESFKRIIELAHERGLSVTLMTDRLTGSIPEVKTKPDSSFDEDEYTRKAIRQLLDQCSGLDGFGFLVNDPEKTESFYSQTVLRSINQSSNLPILFLQTDIADSTVMKRFLESNPRQGVVSVKFNGGFLNTSYPAVGRPSEQPQNQYLDYFSQPHKYGVVFNIAANGSNRLFPWLNIGFIQRTVQSIIKFGANGFILDPLFTLTPNSDIFGKNVFQEYRYYDWPYERDWYWFNAWGRKAFDPIKDEDFFKKIFQSHFGAKAGDLLFDALQNSSGVVPAIESVCYHGDTLESFAPEMDPPPGITDLIQSIPFDPYAVRSITQDAEALTFKQFTAKRSSMEQLRDAMEKTQKAIEQAKSAQELLLGKNTPKKSEDAKRFRECKVWISGFEILSDLAQSWYNQVSAATHFQIFQLSQDIPSLVIASGNVKNAKKFWDAVIRKTTARFSDIPRPTPDGMVDYHWSNVVLPFAEDEKQLTEAYTQWMKKTDWTNEAGHVPVYKAKPGEPLLLTLSIPPAGKTNTFFVQYQNSSGATGNKPLEASRIEGVFFAEIPAEIIKEGVFEYYFFGMAEDRNVPLKGSNSNKPYRVIVTADTEPPNVIKLEHNPNLADGKTTITGEFTDPSGVTEVKLFWKPMPSTLPWQEEIMQPSTQGYASTIPYTPDGVLYAVEVIDGYGNARLIPGLDADCPYQIIPPYAKQPGSN